MRYIAIFLVICGCLNQTIAQSISGKVLDKNNNDPLPFATIAIKGTILGTTTNSQGGFVLSIPDQYRNSSIIVSFMGYQDNEIPISELKDGEVILMEEYIFELQEIEIRPWEVWDYINAAWKNVPVTHTDKPYISSGYYSEYITENDSYLKFTEGVIDTYNIPYGDTASFHSKIVQARTRKDIETLKFMRKRIDKRMEKEKKKAIKRGEEWEETNLDDEIVNSSFGGPSQILEADPLRDTASFIDPRLKKYWNHEIAGYTRIFDQNVIIISYESRKKYEQQKGKGKIYISLEDDAFVAFEFESRIIIPDAVRPLLFLFGLGITDPIIKGAVHYKPFNNKWYLSDIFVDGWSRLTDKNMFKKNEKSFFKIQQGLFIKEYEFENIAPFPEDDWLDESEPLEKQVDEDPQFWENYKVARPVEIN